MTSKSRDWHSQSCIRYKDEDVDGDDFDNGDGAAASAASVDLLDW